MSYTPPIASNVAFTLPAVGQGATVLKRPVAMYAGRLKELQAGDSLFGFLKAWVIKSSAYTLVNGDRILVDTSTTALTQTFPASPSFNDIVAVKDYAGTFATNNCTLNPNGEKIDGVAGNVVLNTNGAKREFVYTGATYGWLTVVN